MSEPAASRILVLKWSALGDVAIASAAIEDIRAAFPTSAIDLNTLPSAARLFRHDPRFHRVIAIDVREKGRRLRRSLEWLRAVHSGRYDLIIDLQACDRSRLLLWALRLCTWRRIALWGNRNGLPYTLGPGLARGTRVSAIDRHRALLARGRVPALARHPVLHASAADAEVAAGLLSQHALDRQPHVVFLPGSQRGGSIKRWGVDNYARLGIGLLESGQAERIVVVGGPNELDDCRAIEAAINAWRPGAALNLHSLPLLQVAPVCGQARAIVANDTGLAHIAAAAGRPMVVVCGPTDPRRVKPVGDRVTALQVRHGCVNCYAKACALAARAGCLQAIEPGAVRDFIARGELAPELAKY